MTPQEGDRVACHEISLVSWPGQADGDPVTGTVTRIAALTFRFLPDFPDPTSNGVVNGHEFDDSEDEGVLGWYVNMTSHWFFLDYVISELELS